MPLGHFRRAADSQADAIIFWEIIAETMFGDVVPLSHFYRVVDSQADAIIFFGNYHRSTVFGFCDIKSFSQSDVFERV